MAYMLLAFSIIAEVFGTTMLKLSNGFSRVFPIIGVAVGFGLAFYLVSIAMMTLPLGFTYAVWSGLGTILTVLIGVFLFNEKINKKAILGIGILLIGIVLLNIA